MTREELIKHLEHLADYVKYSEDAPALREAIEMLKSDDGDTISRQTAVDALIKWYGCEPSDIGAFENIVEKLPSARQERKMGKWVTKSTNGEMFDSCSVCGYVEWDAPRNFCPNCGADMRGKER